MKRTPLKRYTRLKSSVGLASTSRLKPRSPKKAADDARYRRSKAEHLATHPQCMWAGCTKSKANGDLVDVHHKAGRNGPLLYCKRYFATLCRQHHNHVEEHLSWSRANGWIIDLTTEQVRQIRLETQ
ncbi:MAG: hypothetical protein SFV32_12465 [Opitutaceae bacterium]|nr:hypothetical protein [Opitutaceae bacterium]